MNDTVGVWTWHYRAFAALILALSSCGSESTSPKETLDWRVADESPCTESYLTSPEVVEGLIAELAGGDLAPGDVAEERAEAEAQAEQWFSDYRSLPAGLPESDYERYYETAVGWGKEAERLRCKEWLAGNPEYLP